MENRTKPLIVSDLLPKIQLQATRVLSPPKREQPDTEKTVGQLPALTGIRAFAALWVMLYHFSEKNIDTNTWFSWGFLDPFIIRGAAGVDIFFVLSGFILTHVYRRNFRLGVSRDTWLTFLNHRVARLYPVHLITFLAMLVVYVAAKASGGAAPHHGYAFTWYSAIANLTLTHAWFPGRVGAMNGPAWSISAEWFAYLLFPPVYSLLAKTGRSWPWLVASLALAISLNVQSWDPLPQIAVEFCFGMAVYEVYVRVGSLRTRLGGGIGLIVLLFSVYILSKTDLTAVQRGDIHAHVRTGVLLATGLLLTSLANPSDILGRVLRSRLAVYGGEISYSMYMCHWPIWILVHKGLAHNERFSLAPHTLWMAIAGGLTIAASILLYHFVEVPGRQMLRRTVSRPQVAAELASAVH